MKRLTLGAWILTPLVACSDPSRPTDRPATAQITTRTTGLDIDPDGYRVSVDGTDRAAVSSNGSVLTEVDPGSRTIALTGLTPNCSVDGPGSRTVTIVEAEVAPIDFAVVCTATSGVIGVVISGSDLGGGFEALVDRATRLSVRPGAPAYLGGMSAGQHVVSLSGPANCSLETDSQSITVTAGGLIRDTVEAVFSVTCVLDIRGNWQFSTTSTVSGMRPATIAGSITQSGSLVEGAVHLDGSNCFDQLTTIGLTGTLADGNVSLTSTSVDGQVITLTGSLTGTGPTDLVGTYAIEGGCADADQGTVTGLKWRAITGTWRMIVSINGAHSVGRATLTQGSPSPEGSFGVTGAATSSAGSSCYSGPITAGRFPSSSFIMGSSVVLEIKGNGNVVFRGTVNEDETEIVGIYRVVGGTCVGRVGGACLGRNLRRNCRVPPFLSRSIEGPDGLRGARSAQSR